MFSPRGRAPPSRRREFLGRARRVLRLGRELSTISPMCGYLPGGPAARPHATRTAIAAKHGAFWISATLKAMRAAEMELPIPPVSAAHHTKSNSPMSSGTAGSFTSSCATRRAVRCRGWCFPRGRS